MATQEWRFLLSAIAFALLLCASGSCRYYQVSEGETGWTTGLRESGNVSLSLYGLAIGAGDYYRFTEADYNEVRVRERISASDGTLDTKERLLIEADVTEDVEVELEKKPGGQDYTLTVNESWPVAMYSQRSLDFMGKGIYNRDSFGNNLDFVAASFQRVADLKSERTCLQSLENAWFELQLNNTTKAVYVDRFMPNKTIEYDLYSLFEGEATFSYGQSDGRIPISESEERYAGRFQLQRGLLMSSLGRNFTQYDDYWLECCPLQQKNPFLVSEGD